MALKHQAPRGTRDLLPDELAHWQWAETRTRGVMERYGYGEIRTPIFEDFELFARTSGEASDVVKKEMYRFKDLGDRDLALRPEGTASVARAYLERGLGGHGRIHRLWYMGPMFRYGRPQKGRYRQFHQVGAEIIGSPAPGADVEIIALFVDLFEAWGFSNLTVKVNSVGTLATRAEYANRLKLWLQPVHGHLSEESKVRWETNPLRILDSKAPLDQAMLRGEQGPLRPEEMPRLLECLDGESREHWEGVLLGLRTNGIRFEIDHGLVRGLDYYTRTAFEVHDTSLGAQSALGGGGRYDGLIEQLGGPSTPGVGFSIGLDRVLLSLQERSQTLDGHEPSLFIVSSESTRENARRLLWALRPLVRAGSDLEGRSVRHQLEQAGKGKWDYAVILGDEELLKHTVRLKQLGTGEQKELEFSAFIEWLRSMISTHRHNAVDKELLDQINRSQRYLTEELGHPRQVPDRMPGTNE